MNNKRYVRALKRASKAALASGKITQEKFDEIQDVIKNPVRKDKDGNECNILNESRKKCVEIYTIESGQSWATIDVEGFEWGNIWQWIKDHLPQILQVISALLTIFMFL